MIIRTKYSYPLKVMVVREVPAKAELSMLKTALKHDDDAIKSIRYSYNTYTTTSYYPLKVTDETELPRKAVLEMVPTSLAG